MENAIFFTDWRTYNVDKFKFSLNQSIISIQSQLKFQQGFCRNLKFDTKIYMENHRTQNNQNRLEKKKKVGLIPPDLKISINLKQYRYCYIGTNVDQWTRRESLKQTDTYRVNCVFGQRHQSISKGKGSLSHKKG